MAEYRIAQHDLVVNMTDRHFVIPKDDYMLTEADGTISSCTEAELESNVSRIDEAIVARNAELARISEEERLAEELRLEEEAEEQALLDELNGVEEQNG